MATMPETWRRYKSVAALVKAECSGYRPGKYVPPHYCCENCVDGPCLLLADEPEPCQKFEAARCRSARSSATRADGPRAGKHGGNRSARVVRRDAVLQFSDLEARESADSSANPRGAPPTRYQKSKIAGSAREL